MDRPLQDSLCRPGTGLPHHRWPTPSRPALILRPSLPQARTRLQTPRLRSSMQALPEPDDIHDLPTHLPADLTKCVLNSCSTKSPPFHVTVDNISPPPERIEIDQITRHQLVRGRGAVIAAMYETRWADLLSPSWEHEQDLLHQWLHIFRHWSGTPSQHRQTNRVYRPMRIGAAHRELSRSRAEIFFAPRYSLVPRTLWLHRFSSSTLPGGAHL